MALVKDTVETGAAARAERRLIGGRVISINASTNTCQLDVGATLADGSPVYLEGVTFQPQNPPQQGDTTQFCYTNASSHSAVIAGSITGSQAGGTTQVTGAVTSFDGLQGAIATVIGEVPGGAVNGTNTTFTLAHSPVGSKAALYLAGLRVDPSAYSISGVTITFSTAPASGLLLADYVRTA